MTLPVGQIVGMNLREHLTEHGLTREKFAAKVPCTEEHITRIINGERGASIAMMRRIIAASGGEITLAELIAEIEEAQRVAKERAASASVPQNGEAA